MVGFPTGCGPHLLIIVAEPFTLAYVASKFAVRGIMQTAAVELGVHRITANAYAPGAIDTDMCEYFPFSFSGLIGPL